MTHEQTKRPKASRAEKQVRNLGRGLFALSVILLISCVGMTALFGWGLGTDPVNRALLALGFGATDVAGGVIMGFCGACFALKSWRVGTAALACACVCFVVSLYGVIGFQSSNRETLAQARERAVKLSDDYLAWSKSTTATAAKGSGKAQQDLLVTGLNAVGEQVKGQIKMLQDGSLIVPDAQASTLSRLLPVDEATARSWGIMAGSAALLLIQYACLWFYGFLRHKLEPAVIALAAADYRQFAASTAGNLPHPHGFTPDQARADLEILLSSGFDLSKYGAVTQLARRWSWTNNRTARWLRSQSDLNVPPPAKRGPRRVASAPIAVNGRAHVT